MALNRVQLIGNLGSKPELNQTGGGTVVSKFSVATNEAWKDKDGKKQEKVEWHRVVVFGSLAENCVKYLDKGRQVFVEGRNQTTKWQDKAGVDRYTTEVIAQTVQFLGAGSGAKREEVPTTEPAGPLGEKHYTDSDIPF